ncbi:amino acid adenylation domain-containing protein [Streptomyces sp. NPDC048211]|uniref:non-ribosomal peptide synthetase n=1 Tax=Streptomyces sp. NPDC048211 TaxID=3365516 RepID=UPI00372469E7
MAPDAAGLTAAPAALTGPQRPLAGPLLPELLDTIAAARPEATALVAPDATYTYARLHAHVQQLARLIAERTAGAPDDEVLVAVLLPRGAASLTALLAVLAAGATYVPVDSGYPPNRIAAMLADTGPHLLISTRALAAERAPDIPALLLDAPEVAADIAARPTSALTDRDRVRPLSPRSAAYVLFTSGSTGRPKGVVVEHRSLLNLLVSHREAFFGRAAAHLGRSRLRVAHTAALSFDAAWDPVLWLFEGHELHLIDDTTRRDPALLVAYIADRGIDVVETTPTIAEQLEHCGLFTATGRHRLGVLALGGEPIGSGQWTRLRGLPHLLALNLYGPSECTVDAFVAPLSDSPSPTIGPLPVANTVAYVLDEAGKPCAAGEIGELHLGGAGVARGYLGRPDLTAERFRDDPWLPGGRLYRTGDLVRILPHGVVFVGRADGQVKLHGQRLETGEVETVLVRHRSVAQAAVVLREDAPGAQRLVGYVVPAAGARCAPDELMAHAAESLPAYMVPSEVVSLAELPLTPNGKLDRSALPRPERAGTQRAGVQRLSAGRAHSVPAQRTPAERLLCRHFSDVLGGGDVGPEDDFFHSGGDSMGAIRLIAALRAQGMALRLQDVFEHRTPKALADLVDIA